MKKKGIAEKRREKQGAVLFFFFLVGRRRPNRGKQEERDVVRVTQFPYPNGKIVQ